MILYCRMVNEMGAVGTPTVYVPVIPGKASMKMNLRKQIAEKGEKKKGNSGLVDRKSSYSSCKNSLSFLPWCLRLSRMLAAMRPVRHVPRIGHWHLIQKQTVITNEMM